MIVNELECDATVCCLTQDRSFFTSQWSCAEIDGVQGRSDECSGVCCEEKDGGYAVKDVDVCVERGGTPSPGAGCLVSTEIPDDTADSSTEDHVCCYLAGLVQPLPADECKDRGGSSFENSDLCGEGGSCDPSDVAYASDGARYKAAVRVDTSSCACEAWAPGDYSDLMYFAVEVDHIFASKGPGWSIVETDPPGIVMYGSDITPFPLGKPVTIMFSGDMYGMWASLEVTATMTGLSGVSVTCW